MTTEIKPVPTDYKGIRFRSKSEAMMALFLDENRFHWIYEPHQFAVNGVAPDFVCVQTGMKLFKVEIFEYKPREPSEAYKESVAVRLDAMAAMIHFPIFLHIVHIDWFDDESNDGIITASRNAPNSERNRFCAGPLICLFDTEDPNTESPGWKSPFRNFRFDLKT